MNKKKLIMFGALGLFTIALVSAIVIINYVSVQQEIVVNSPIELEELVPEVISGFGTGSVLGSLVTVENVAPFDVDVNVDSVVEPTDDITTSYINELRLSKKVVVFGTNNWAEAEGDVIVEYTVIGDNLLAEVVDEDKVSDYVLIYYADNVDRFNNVAKAVNVEDVDESLPYVGDANIDLYDMCELEGYVTCHGAKIWYVPSDAITDGNIDWARASDFYFETNLIHYFKTVDGNTVIPEGVSMEFFPLYEFGAIDGTYTVTTSVSPVTA